MCSYQFYFKRGGVASGGLKVGGLDKERAVTDPVGELGLMYPVR